jgi:hypothetical protein
MSLFDSPAETEVPSGTPSNSQYAEQNCNNNKNNNAARPGCTSACKNSRMSPAAALAPEFIWMARPVPVKLRSRGSVDPRSERWRLAILRSTTMIFSGFSLDLREHLDQLCNGGGLIVDWDHYGDCGQRWHSLCDQPDRSHAALDIQADLHRRPLISVVHIAVAALA